MRKRRTIPVSALLVLTLALATAACEQNGAPAAKTVPEEDEESELSGPLTGVDNGHGLTSAVPVNHGSDDGLDLPVDDGHDPAEAVPAANGHDPVLTVPVVNEVLAEAQLDVDGDGEMERLVVRMTRGEKREETEPGSHMGIMREGDVRLELYHATGGLLHARELNPDFGGEPMRYEERRHFTLNFADYNNDGLQEFVLGQYFSSNWFSFNLYDVSADGFRLLLPGLLTSNSQYAIRFERIASQAFTKTAYSMDKGIYEKRVFAWVDGRYVHLPDPAFTCDGCRRIDEDWPGLSYIPTEDGFVLVPDEPVNPIYRHLSPPIDGQTYIVQEMNLEHPEVIRHAAAVLHPDSGEVAVYKLYEASPDSAYKTMSVAHGHGFLPDGQWVFISVVQDPDHPASERYQVNKMNIQTGEVTAIVPELPGSAEESYYSSSWMNEAGTKLVLNGSDTGRMWVIDLAGGEVAELADRFKQYWPMASVYQSPDGERFWYEQVETLDAPAKYRLYDLNGRELAVFPKTDHFDNYSIAWSLDGQYAVYGETLDRNEKHIRLFNGEYDVIAPQRLTFFDRDGAVVRIAETTEDGIYLEPAGWPETGGNRVLLERYRLVDNEEYGAYRHKRDHRYALLDLQSGEETPLEIVDQLALEEHGEVFRGGYYGPFSLVDADNGRMVLFDAANVEHIATNGEEPAWLATDETGAQKLFVWDPSTGRLLVHDVPFHADGLILLDRTWSYISQHMAGHRLPDLADKPPSH